MSSYTITDLTISTPQLSINPANINQQVKISVKVVESTRAATNTGMSNVFYSNEGEYSDAY